MFVYRRSSSIQVVGFFDNGRSWYIFTGWWDDDSFEMVFILQSDSLLVLIGADVYDCLAVCEHDGALALDGPMPEQVVGDGVIHGEPPAELCRHRTVQP